MITPEEVPSSTPDGKGARATPSIPPEIKQATPEEQMEAFEKDLKENDWGHQPC